MSIQYAIDVLEEELEATKKFKELAEFRHGFFSRNEDIEALKKAIRILGKNRDKQGG